MLTNYMNGEILHSNFQRTAILYTAGLLIVWNREQNVTDVVII